MCIRDSDDKAQENLNFCCNLFKQAHVIHRQNIVIEELRDIETRWKDSTEMNPYGLKYN